MMEEVIAVIRTNGGTAVPLIAGFDFGYDLTPVAIAPPSTPKASATLVIPMHETESAVAEK